MPKMKTHKSSQKRFSISKSGYIKRSKAYKSHILTKKTTKRKRHLRKTKKKKRIIKQLFIKKNHPTKKQI